MRSEGACYREIADELGVGIGSVSALLWTPVPVKAKSRNPSQNSNTRTISDAGYVVVVVGFTSLATGWPVSLEARAAIASDKDFTGDNTLHTLLRMQRVSHVSAVTADGNDPPVVWRTRSAVPPSIVLLSLTSPKRPPHNAVIGIQLTGRAYTPAGGTILGRLFVVGEVGVA